MIDILDLKVPSLPSSLRWSSLFLNARESSYYFSKVIYLLSCPHDFTSFSHNQIRTRPSWKTIEDAREFVQLSLTSLYPDIDKYAILLKEVATLGKELKMIGVIGTNGTGETSLRSCELARDRGLDGKVPEEKKRDMVWWYVDRPITEV